MSKICCGVSTVVWAKGTSGRVGLQSLLGVGPALTRILRLRKAEAPHTFLTRVDVQDLARLSGLKYPRTSSRSLSVPPLGVGAILNALLEALPLVREFGVRYDAGAKTAA